ncbi:MAG: cation-transporting P-type ATPase, partial [Bacteroidota bacterium]|nr:cation-transporting P-type ATPase [Bacteroidota bacterium]
MAKNNTSIRVSDLLVQSARQNIDQVFAALQTSSAGITAAEAEERQQKYGLNEITQEKQHGWVWRFGMALRNPLVVLLSGLAILSFVTGDIRAGIVMALMVVLGVVLRFVQEARADSAAAKLKAMISVTATAIRDSVALEIPLKELVPGDIIKLSAGDMIPADVRINTSKDLFITQASLTGESLPVEKFDAREIRDNITPLEFLNTCYLGTSVESGTA